MGKPLYRVRIVRSSGDDGKRMPAFDATGGDGPAEEAEGPVERLVSVQASNRREAMILACRQYPGHVVMGRPTKAS